MTDVWSQARERYYEDATGRQHPVARFNADDLGIVRCNPNDPLRVVTDRPVSDDPAAVLDVWPEVPPPDDGYPADYTTDEPTDPDYAQWLEWWRQQVFGAKPRCPHCHHPLNDD